MRGRALVAWNLRRIRVKRGLSQERLAFDAGIDRSYVGGLERQEENPTVDLLDRLAKTLSVHVSDLLVEPPRGASPPKALRRGRPPAK
ncbi:helix-turn-helix domain-containing protein [Bradyrhizobium sp.]|uniref:helix-turn-helix domain-containing protein n=1 Tax=Bradyrhizobium sp. TaxID=376 RepID=UPI003C502782